MAKMAEKYHMIGGNFIMKTETKESKRAHTAWNDHIENPDAEFKGRKIPDEVEARLASGQRVSYQEVTKVIDKIKKERTSTIDPEEQKERKRRAALLSKVETLSAYRFGEELDALLEETIKKELEILDTAILKKAENLARIPAELNWAREEIENDIITFLRKRVHLEYDDPRDLYSFKGFLNGLIAKCEDALYHLYDVRYRINKFGFDAFYKFDSESGDIVFEDYYQSVLTSFFMQENR